MAVGQDQAAADAQLKRRVKQLEKKVATLSVLNGALKDENDDLKERCESLAAEGGGGGGTSSSGQQQEVEELKEEFAERLAHLENKLMDVTEQRDVLKSELRDAVDETESKATRMQDKEDTILALQTEGDELARKIGELQGTVKKLRSSLREEKAERERLQDQVEVIKKDFRRENTNGGGGGDSGTKFEALSKELEQERSKYEAMSNKLKDAYDTKFQDYKKQIQDDHKVELLTLREKEYKLSEQVQRLQGSLMDLEATTGEREDAIRKENRFLEHKYQQLETRLEEMRNSYTDQSKPYLAEIEILRAEATRGEAESSAALGELRRRLSEREKQIRALEGKLLASETIAMSTEEVVIKLKETVADTNKQLDQQHQRVLGSVRKAAALENEVKALKEREADLLHRLDRQEVDYERKLSDKSSEIRSLEERYQGMVKLNGVATTAGKEGEGESAEGDKGQDKDTMESSGLEDLLRDSKANLNWGLMHQRGDRDQAGEVKSLRSQLRDAVESRNELVEEVVGLTKRYDTAVVLIGEGEERIEQLEDDIREMKAIFHEQISIMADQLQLATQAERKGDA